MRDPFPVPPIPALTKAVQPWAEYFSLPTLPLHVHEIVLIAAFYQFVGRVLSPALSMRWFPSTYSSLSRSKRLSWDVHVVSLVQSSLINVLALWVMWVDDERRAMDWQERVWGYDGAAAMIQALAAGYFLWDLCVTAANVDIFGLGMLAHAISALLVYSFGFRPFLNYYSCNFILWELSSPFLNIHWFFDKLGMTGTRAQLVNGLVLIATFFSCRLVWGTIQSFLVFQDIFRGLGAHTTYLPALLGEADATEALGAELLGSDLQNQNTISYPPRYAESMQFVTAATTVPHWIAAVYIGANLTLNSLNFYWFFKMIDAVRKRFQPQPQQVPVKAKADADKPADEDKEVRETKATGVDGGGPDGVVTRARRRTLLDGEEADEPPPI
ncbi:TLC domain-containing protein [Xylariomycetidae sp. FL0641]|nr:TLC domain-containing protein [Xylariomycetidae sp. FL0641]